MKPPKNFEMANSDDPEGIISATQRTIVRALREVVARLRTDIKASGLTWDQIDELLIIMDNKKVEVFQQSDEM